MYDKREIPFVVHWAVLYTCNYSSFSPLHLKGRFPLALYSHWWVCVCVCVQECCVCGQYMQVTDVFSTSCIYYYIYTQMKEVNYIVQVRC